MKMNFFRKHIIAMIVVASGDVSGVVTGLIIWLTTGNWVLAVVVAVIIIVVIGFIGFLIAAINMLSQFRTVTGTKPRT